MFAMKKISQRAHESSNKTVSHQAAEHVAQAITLLQIPFATSAALRRLLLCCNFSFLVMWDTECKSENWKTKLHHSKTALVKVLWEEFVSSTCDLPDCDEGLFSVFSSKGRENGFGNWTLTINITDKWSYQPGGKSIYWIWLHLSVSKILRIIQQNNALLIDRSVDMILNSICPLELELQLIQSAHFALGNSENWCSFHLFITH